MIAVAAHGADHAGFGRITIHRCDYIVLDDNWGSAVII
jgi:hypothetical protein